MTKTCAFLCIDTVSVDDFSEFSEFCGSHLLTKMTVYNRNILLVCSVIQKQQSVAFCFMLVLNKAVVNFSFIQLKLLNVCV